MEKKKAIWVDCDGTLASCELRRFHITEHNDWKSFFEGIPDDTIYEHTEAVVRAMHAAGYAIVIVTARPDESTYKQMTIDWLDRHNIPYSAIYMRRGGDYRKDSIVKIELLQQIMDDGWDIKFALDDRTQVVSALREYGMPVMQVNDGDFDNEPKYNKKFAGQQLLTMLVGVSGVGKSTYIEKHYDKSKVISSDKIREELFSSFTDPVCFTPDNMNLTWKYVHSLVKARLDVGLETILDSTSLRGRDRKSVLVLVPPGVIVKYVVLCRNYDEVLKTKGWRSEEIINKHWKTFKGNIKEILAGDSSPYVVVEDKREFKF